MYYQLKKKSRLPGKILKTSFTKLTKQIIQTMCGFSPYEKKII